jgi:transposase-like protein
MKQQRRHFTAAEKAAIVREHLLDKVPVSDLCDKHGLHPTVFYRWQKELFENAPAAFQSGTGTDKREKALEQKITHLEQKLAHKDEVIAEIMHDHVALKKKLGLS